MNRLFLVSTLTFGFVSLASPQWLETTVPLPDSFSGTTKPTHLVWSPANNTVYVGGEVGNCVVGLDGTTGEKVARVPTSYPITGLACSLTRNKVYALNLYQGVITVFDAATNQPVRDIRIITYQTDMYYNSLSDKLYYVGGQYATSIACESDSVVSVMHRYGSLGSPRYDQSRDLLYCSDSYNHGVWTIEGSPDSLTRFIATDRESRQLAYCGREDKLYCTNGYGLDSTMSVIDCSTGTVIRTLTLFRGPRRPLYNPFNNRLYVTEGSNGSRIAVLDCVTDSAVAFINVGSSPIALSLDSTHNRVYCANYLSQDVSVIDCARDSVVATIHLDDTVTYLCHAVDAHRMFTIGRGTNRVSVIDTDSNRVVGSTQLAMCAPPAVCFHPNNARVYCACGSIDSVAVIASETNIVTALVPVGDRPALLCSNPVDNKVYCAGADRGLTVIDAGNDTAIATLEVGARPSALCFNSTADKVYCASRSDSNVSVIDGVTNGLVAVVGVGAQPAALCVNPLDNKVYCANNAGGTVSVINGSNDSLITTVSVGSQPVALCFNSVNDKVYCANSGGASISVIDGVSNRLLGNAPAAGSPVALCYNPLADRVYCANSTSNNITVLDGAADTLLAIVPVGLRPAALAFDSAHNYIYCVNPDGDSVTVIDAAFNIVMCRVPVGDNPVALAWAPAVERMYVANQGGSSVSVISTTPPGVGENTVISARRHPPLVVRGSLFLTDSDRATLLDATGRTVLRLHAGANDVKRLPAGVYFLCASPRAPMRKLLLLR